MNPLSLLDLINKMASKASLTEIKHAQRVQAYQYLHQWITESVKKEQALTEASAESKNSEPITG